MSTAPRNPSRRRRTVVVLALFAAAASVLGAAAYLVLQGLRRDARVAGEWSGEGWGAVRLSRTAPGRLEGTYSSVYGPTRGRIEVRWNAQRARYEGTWSEGRYRFGTLEFAFDAGDGRVRGIWRAAAECESRPGEPAAANLEWSPNPSFPSDELPLVPSATWRSGAGDSVVPAPEPPRAIR